MPNLSAQRFRFIAHALRGDGPFAPVVLDDGQGRAQLLGRSYLVRYPRESQAKYNRRNELAFYASPLARAASRFVGYLSARPPSRDLGNELCQRVAEDTDGRGNALQVFLSDFAVQAKARGSMLLLVDMPQDLPASREQQVRARAVPYWSAIAPEDVSDYKVGDDGKFDFVEFAGTWGPEAKACTWHFDRQGWWAKDNTSRMLANGAHPLGECPVIIFTERGEYPCFGPFAAIADLAKRQFNLDSELDEILRAQTFSLLHLPVPEGSTDEQKLAAAQTAGETIGTNNLLVHSGAAPGFIAPPNGPAEIYLQRIEQIERRIAEVGLDVVSDNPQESGVARRLRFAAINGELAHFAERMEGLERRAWDMTRRWLGLTAAPTVQWSRDFNLADVAAELAVLRDMRDNGMPDQVIVEQERRIVAVQFGGLDQQRQDEIEQALAERLLEPSNPDNVVPLRPDPNAPVREAIVRALGNAGA
jgi:hypothetical protein